MSEARQARPSDCHVTVAHLSKLGRRTALFVRDAAGGRKPRPTPQNNGQRGVRHPWKQLTCLISCICRQRASSSRAACRVPSGGGAASAAVAAARCEHPSPPTALDHLPIFVYPSPPAIDG
ncbi:hypothetical protein JDV02_004950 [Purpureocillium takamizusanense]|uniref:Uncharacterized protein n=1 Tax=Purpureocillium takamizusanense TaxID=2060973 RepID=A0A9Q8V9V6_9HYPO|nr:uncharacterized protein JDV02_004950 [Purpureocillium takamizusanense]UNI18695.1 hypothetical protein JDV02_004950 [Purpureocillium takamizusanense]